MFTQRVAPQNRSPQAAPLPLHGSSDEPAIASDPVRQRQSVTTAALTRLFHDDGPMILW